MIRFVRFIADIWKELKFKDSSNFEKKKNRQKFIPTLK